MDKNLTNFFLIVERNRAMILSTLSSDQISELLQLRNEMLIDANLKRDADEDSDDDPETAHLDRPAPATQKKNKDGVTDDNKSQQQPPPDETSQPQFPPITRELLVRFLKLEKFRLQKLKKVRKVAQLLEEFIEQSDLSKE